MRMRTTDPYIGSVRLHQNAYEPVPHAYRIYVHILGLTWLVAFMYDEVIVSWAYL